MFKYILFLFLILGFHGFASAQEIPSRSIYAELWGAGITYSINYDFRFDKDDINSWGMRIGAGALATNRTEYSKRFLNLPVQFNKLLGKHRHFFEFGGGVTFLYFRGRGSSGGTELVNKNYNFLLDADNTPALMGTLNIGYRFIPKESGFTFRANVA
ncbi:MAG: hypothetical protein M3421_11525, partial [Bacteroidota bacterium]|nr:hypothetical protein [Bacteroidota bacterium]